ncbi:Dynein regulatory complex subunit 3 [Nowakowskiella sp. JEL0407]|nr:Dynein regulatory complex subunit 3 [Nowakowskiella sp. JEL0407]
MKNKRKNNKSKSIPFHVHKPQCETPNGNLLIFGLLPEIHRNIFRYLDIRTLCHLSLTCRTFFFLVDNEAFRPLYLLNDFDVKALPNLISDKISKLLNYTHNAQCYPSYKIRYLFACKVDFEYCEIRRITSRRSHSYWNVPTFGLAGPWTPWLQHPKVRLSSSSDRHSWSSDILAVSSNNRVDLWKLSPKHGFWRFEEKHTMQNNNSDVTALELNKFEHHDEVFVGYENGSITQWKYDSYTDSFQTKKLFRKHSASVKSLAVIDDKNVMVSASRDRTLNVWDTASELTDKLLLNSYTFTNIGKNHPLCLKYVPQKLQIVVGLSSTGSIRSSSHLSLLKVLTVTPSGSLILDNDDSERSDFSLSDGIRHHGSSINDICGNVLGNQWLIGTACYDGVARVFDLRLPITSYPVAKFEDVNDYSIYSIASSHWRIATGCSWHGVVRVWDARMGLSNESSKSKNQPSLLFSTYTVPKAQVPVYSIQMDHSQPTVIDEDLLRKAVNEQVPVEIAEVARREGIDPFEVTSLRLDYKSSYSDPNNLWAFENLTKLQLDNNIIERIENIGFLKNLQWLDLSFNNITQIEGLDKLTNLTDLSLYNNRISKIENMEDLFNLQVFSIGNNNLTVLENLSYLSRFENLRVLNAAGNSLCKNPNYRHYVLAHIRNLKYLDYRLVDEESVAAARERYIDDLIAIEEEEKVAIGRKEEMKRMREAEELCEGAHVAKIDRLFDEMFDEDQDFQKLLPLARENIEELRGDYRAKFEVIAKELKHFALKKNKDKADEFEMFQKCKWDAKMEKDEDGIKQLHKYQNVKKQLLKLIQNSKDAGEIDDAIKLLKDQTQTLSDLLMDHEMSLVEQFEDVMKDFERCFTEMCGTIGEYSQQAFANMREAENEFHERFTELVMSSYDRFQKGDMDELDDELRNEDRLLTGTNRDQELVIQKAHEDEIQRNRDRICEINAFLDKCNAEIEVAEEKPAVFRVTYFGILESMKISRINSFHKTLRCIISVLLFCNCIALPRSINEVAIERFDTISITSDYLKQTYSPIRNVAIQSDAEEANANSTLATEPFAFMIRCMIPDTNLCRNMENGLKRAAIRIANIVLIYRQILVEVNITSLGPKNNVLGSAGPAAYFKGVFSKSENSSGYLFPQGLVKQMLKNVEFISYAPFDIVSYFYNDRAWYFPEYGRPINPSENDFELVACHELIHGLGMVSRWNSVQDIFPPAITNGRIGLIPPIGYENNTGAVSLQSWQPLSVFDRFLYLDYGTYNVSCNLLATNITNYRIIDGYRTPESFFSGLMGNQDARNAAREMFALATKGNGLIFTPDRSYGIDKVELAANDPFRKGSSIHHVDDAYNVTNDLLMTATVQFQGRSMSQLIKDKFLDSTRNDTESTVAPFGVNVRAMLYSIGWSTVDKPGRRELYLLPTTPSQTNVETGPLTFTFPTAQSFSFRSQNLRQSIFLMLLSFLFCV